MTESEHGRPQDPSEQELELAMSEVLELWSDEQHALVDEAVDSASEADYQAALRTFQGLAGKRRPWARFGWMAAVAATLLMAVGYMAWSPSGAPAPAVLLGSGEMEALSPAGEVDGYDVFSWKAKGNKLQRYGLRVWNEGVLDAVVRIDGLEQPEYTLSEGQRVLLGSRITWQVLLQTPEGGTLGVESASASLR